jgi:dynein assembly factor 1, axonemal
LMGKLAIGLANNVKECLNLSMIQAFSGLKALYLEGNAISVIENMQHMSDLKCLFIAKNVLHGLEGIQQMTALATLDVSHNDLYSLAPLSALVGLQSLNVGHNKLSSAEDIAPLLHCPRLKTLDLEKNRIACPEALNTIMSMPLALLRLVGNPVVSATKYLTTRAALLCKSIAS